MFGGDMIKNLNALGYRCCAASVDPDGTCAFDPNTNVEFPVKATGGRMMDLTGTTPGGFVAATCSARTTSGRFLLIG